MGLHLNFELRLPASTSPDAVASTLLALRTFALTLPFAEVSPFLSDSAAVSSASPAQLEALKFWASLVAEPFDDDEPALHGDEASAQGFNIHPGDGCESAFVGLMRRSDATGEHAEWYWRTFCKTQYASTVSDAHLIACHTSLVRLLDFAIERGVDVAVYDETHYWETRDKSRLLSEVHAMNRLVAKFAGRLSDAMGENDIQASIFSHPRFEHLEMEKDD